jgi:hypothetical protein
MTASCKTFGTILTLVPLLALMSACGNDPEPTESTASQPTPTEQPSSPKEPAMGTYRVTVNGFRVVSETWDHAGEVDGKGDEVYLSVGMKVLDGKGKPKVPVTGGNPAAISAVMGDVNGQNGRVRAGTRGPRNDPGGLQTGDTFPNASPWKLNGAPTQDRPPFAVGTVKLIEGNDSMLICPTIWEWDGGSDVFRDWVGWFQQAAGKIPAPVAGSKAGVVLEATKAGLGLAMSLSDAGILGQAADRPIGIKTQGPNGFTFDPQIISLDYTAAEWLVNNDPQGKGNGVLELAYQDDAKYHGYYVLYLQVTKVS